MTIRWVAGFVLFALAPQAVAQRASGFSDSVTVVPGADYAKGGVYRFFFGDHYRDLWTTPIRVPVLDLKTYAGGLTPTERGGGQQTRSLRFKGADGREYAFRSVDKDPTAALPVGLQETFADRIFQDQISSGHPAGALVVSPILEAAGVLHATPVLVVMPDDPALGEFRADFKNMLGFLEERPRDADKDGISFAGAKEIVGTEKFLDQLDDHPEVRLDAREFLLARLTDVFLGDWDRHRDQWRWALVEDGRGSRWLPIPRDRDQALVRFDGFLLSVVRRQVPQLVNFDKEYPSMLGATWNGRDLDRRLLTELERPVWDSVAGVLTARLTNDVIDRAVAALPPEFAPIDGARLRAALLARRDGIREMAMDYYEHLAREVDVYGSDRADIAEARPVDGRSVEVTIRLAGTGSEPYYRRRFFRGETKDIRIYLQGGPDSAHISGDRSFPVEVRVLGGGGDDRFVNEGNASAKFYDNRGTNSASRGSINTKDYIAIEDSTNPTAQPHRDWGKKRLSYPVASFGPDAGLMLGWGGRFTRWAFRKKPSASFFHYNAVFATGATTGRLSMYGRFQRENSRSYLAFNALLSGIEAFRWYGFGNETLFDQTRSRSFYRSTQHEVDFSPSIGWALGERTTLELGPRLKYSVTELDDQNADRFIALDRPYGTGNFGQIGFGGSLVVDTRDMPLAARKGVHLELGGSAYPRLADVKAPFGEVHGRVATYLTARIPGTPTLALQVGAKKVFATQDSLPFYEAAFLGSTGTLRGFRSHRFAGDRGAVFGTAELRLHVTNAFIFVPGRQGLVGFYDFGRVYHSGETSDAWHHSFGGGIWLAFLTPGSVLSAVLGHSDEGNKVYVRIGFAF